jgi:hypothetical protein
MINRFDFISILLDEQVLDSLVDLMKLNGLLDEKLKDYKIKENEQLEAIRIDHDVKVKSYRDKYKQLEEKELNYLENEFNKVKQRLEEEYKQREIDYEYKLRQKTEKIHKDVRLCFINI